MRRVATYLRRFLACSQTTLITAQPGNALFSGRRPLDERGECRRGAHHLGCGPRRCRRRCWVPSARTRCLRSPPTSQRRCNCGRPPVLHNHHVLIKRFDFSDERAKRLTCLGHRNRFMYRTLATFGPPALGRSKGLPPAGSYVVYDQVASHCTLSMITSQLRRLQWRN
jgi:hypothetical protein